MRKCDRCQGTCEIDTSENEDGTQLENCWMCEGSGEVEDGCICAARSPYECGCGGFDVDLEYWEED